MISLVPPKGMRDFIPCEFRKREHLLQLISSTLKEHGFHQIETPALEDIAKLKAKEGGDNESMLFEVMRRGLDPESSYRPSEACDLALRYDLTLPLSRFYAHNQAKLPTVFRAFQTGWVWRAERPQKGRFRQFRQCDIDIIGPSDWTAELELLSLGWTVLEKLGLSKNACILINDRRLLDYLANSYEIAGDKRGQFFIILDKLEKIGLDAVVDELVSKEIMARQAAQELMNLLLELKEESSQAGTSGASLQLTELLEKAQIPELSLLISALKELKPEIELRFDPSLVRGMGYYTGIVYEVVHTSSSSSICGGGRYDKIIGKWLGKEVCAVGFSFGFERILELLDEAAQEDERLDLALCYSSAEDHLKALHLREAIKSGELTGFENFKEIGLVKAPSKIKNSFFEQVAQDYKSALLPSALDLDSKEALEKLKHF